MWRWIVELVASAAFGFAAIVPVFNNEAYIVGAHATGLAALVPVWIGLTVGNGVGKAFVVWLLRQGRRLPWWRDRPEPEGEPSRWRRWMDQLLALVGSRWGAALVVVSAAMSIPPLYPTTVAVAASRMRLLTFWAACTLGIAIRVGALCLLTQQLL